jgi:Transposase DDE domain/Domain of unknown function (DUF4372)
MQAFCSLFSQILKVIPRGGFEQLVRQHGSERHARGFTSWQQLVAMLFCHIGRAQSLREIEHGLRSAEGKLNHLGIEVPCRSTLSYANEHRPWQLFESLFYQVLEQCRSARPGRHALRFKNPLLSIDSTTVELVSEMFSWARYTKRKGAIKLHLVLDHDGLLPTYAVVTELSSGDITVGRTLSFDAGAVIVFDRGYIDYEWLRSLEDRGVFFVTRLKKTARFTVIEQRKPPQSRSVIVDQVVDLTHVRRSTRGGFVPLRLRRVEVVDPETGKHLVFYSNLLHFGATTISQIYKQRWQIELFFKALKQNLKIKTFIGTSANALRIQLWTALIAMVLIRYLKLKSASPVSLSNLVAMLRFHLFSYRELWAWLCQPFAPAHSPPPTQLQLL